MKKVIRFLLFAIIVLCSFPISAMSAEPSDDLLISEGISYVKNYHSAYSYINSEGTSTRRSC